MVVPTLEFQKIKSIEWTFPPPGLHLYALRPRPPPFVFTHTIGLFACTMLMRGYRRTSGAGQPVFGCLLKREGGKPKKKVPTPPLEAGGVEFEKGERKEAGKGQKKVGPRGEEGAWQSF